MCYNARINPSEALEAYRAELRELATRHGLERSSVFVSVLTGTDDEASDLDLLVDPTKTTTLFTLAGFKADAEDLLGIPVSAASYVEQLHGVEAFRQNRLVVRISGTCRSI